MTYTKALELWSKRRRDNPRKKVGNNTYLWKEGDVFKITLHNTVVVRLFKGGEVQLRSGGFRSVTTKSRINNFGLPNSAWRLVQQDYEWFLYHNHTNEKIPFEEGMFVPHDDPILRTCQLEESKEAGKEKPQ